LRFDVILTNPPFQDSVKRNSTPHKLWIDFTKAVFERLLADDGILCQVSPASFGSPSNVVLDLMREYQTLVLRTDTEGHFRRAGANVGSTFSDYAIRKAPTQATKTRVSASSGEFDMQLDLSIWYLPNDLCQTSISIHRKVIFQTEKKLLVQWDYVTCHNIRRYARRGKEATLSEVAHEDFPFPVYHTNNKIWWTSVRPDWSTQPKVVWSRSGYMKPVPDSGQYCVTDMAYFILTDTPEQAEILAANMQVELFQYIYKTAKWSGYGNERVFAALPYLPSDRFLTDEDAYALFGLTDEEVSYVKSALAPKPRKGPRQS
jgi:hypothetical protein